MIGIPRGAPRIRDRMFILSITKVNQGQELFVVHPVLMQARDRFADSVLDGTDDSLHFIGAGVVLGNSYSELNGGKFDISMLIRSLPDLTILSPESIQMI